MHTYRSAGHECECEWGRGGVVAYIYIYAYIQGLKRFYLRYSDTSIYTSFSGIIILSL